MSFKLVTRVLVACDTGVNQCWAKVYIDTDVNEYRVKFYRQAEYIGSGSDYYTDDKQDAINTARIQTLKGY